MLLCILTPVSIFIESLKAAITRKQRECALEDPQQHLVLASFWSSTASSHLTWRHHRNAIQANLEMLTVEIGHAGWLGWPANLSPAAELYAKVYNTANKPASLRGLATNVANYNGWSLTTCPSYTSGDANCDEKKYINALAPLLKSAGWDAHFITDTGT